MNRLIRILPLVLAVSLIADVASAACMNRFRNQTDGDKQVVTLLSGALTYQEAQALASAIRRGNTPGLEWIGAGGKVVATQSGDLKVIRPMPVRCGNKSSGVVMTVAFVNATAPAGKMMIRFEGKAIVEFEQQTD